MSLVPLFQPTSKLALLVALACSCPVQVIWAQQVPLPQECAHPSLTPVTNGTVNLVSTLLDKSYPREQYEDSLCRVKALVETKYESFQTLCESLQQSFVAPLHNRDRIGASQYLESHAELLKEIAQSMKADPFCQQVDFELTNATLRLFKLSQSSVEINIISHGGMQAFVREKAEEKEWLVWISDYSAGHKRCGMHTSFSIPFAYFVPIPSGSENQVWIDYSWLQLGQFRQAFNPIAELYINGKHEWAPFIVASMTL